MSVRNCSREITVPLHTFRSGGSAINSRFTTDISALHYPGRHVLARVRINESEKYEVSEKDSGIGPEAAHQSLPVHLPRAAFQHMGDVGAVVSLSLHDEAFDQIIFFSGNELDRQPEDFTVYGVFEPEVIDHGDAVPAPKIRSMKSSPR